MKKLWKSYQQWKEDGFYVIEGEHSTRRTKTGVPLFSEDQVAELGDFMDNIDTDDFFYDYD